MIELVVFDLAETTVYNGDSVGSTFGCRVRPGGHLDRFVLAEVIGGHHHAGHRVGVAAAEGSEEEVALQPGAVGLGELPPDRPEDRAAISRRSNFSATNPTAPPPAPPSHASFSVRQAGSAAMNAVTNASIAGVLVALDLGLFPFAVRGMVFSSQPGIELHYSTRLVTVRQPRGKSAPTNNHASREADRGS
jgi:hypothetical protein